MKNTHIPVLLLNLTQKESKLFTVLFLIYEYLHLDKEVKEDEISIFKIKDISKLSGLSQLQIVDTLNKLVIKNIVGKIVYDGIVNPKVIKNFDEAFINTLYNKNEPYDSATKRAGFIVDDVKDIYVLNPIQPSWKYPPKSKIGKVLRNLNKVVKDDLIDYLLQSLENGRESANTKISGWNLFSSVELFREKYRVHYGNVYTATNIDFGHMKRLLEQLTTNNLPKDRLGLFFEYAFDKAKNKDYVLQVFGLKYYANEYLANTVRNQTGVK